MFGFLKKKVKDAVSKISTKVEEEVPTEEVEIEVPSIEDIDKEVAKEKKGLFKKVFKSKEEKEKIKTQNLIEKEKKLQKYDEKEGLFEKVRKTVATKKISEDKFEDLFWELELALLENNVAMEVIEKIKHDLKEKLTNKPIKKDQVANIVVNSLKETIEDLLSFDVVDIVEKAKEKKPYVICFLGINGSGKTTTIAKVAKMFIDNNLNVVMAASDTFRAAAIEQLEKHAQNLNVKMIKHEYGSDAAAVAYDAIEHAKAKGKDVVLIDTAGRLHSNKDLMAELKKIIKVGNPDMKIFVGESITGNDCVEQAKEFNDMVGIDGIILSKADIDEKGGAALSVAYVTNKPILYIGTGQGYDDLEKFDKDKIMKSLGL
ncbi:signal recognition particle-docking protein FtsY [Candidatus Woesearchaeota archaeon]|nr:MAG: signal recognition particle-docking protein FtsY [Candidatus Woesearchaeota archaeon]